MYLINFMYMAAEMGLTTWLVEFYITEHNYASIKSAQCRHFEKYPFYFRLVVQRWSKVQNHPHFQLELCTVYM